MIEYSTKRIAPNNTEYRFLLLRADWCSSSFITVTRVRKWYLQNEVILTRKIPDNLQALKFFQGLLDSFPRDPLYRE